MLVISDHSYYDPATLTTMRHVHLYTSCRGGGGVILKHKILLANTLFFLHTLIYGGKLPVYFRVIDNPGASELALTYLDCLSRTRLASCVSPSGNLIMVFVRETRTNGDENVGLRRDQGRAKKLNSVIPCL